MLLRESNDHRRTDLATQQRILRSGNIRRATHEHTPQPVSALRSDEGQEADSGIHAGRASDRELSPGGGTAQEDAIEAEQGEQGLVSEPSLGNRGQDPCDSGGGSKCGLDITSLHGEPRLARNYSEQLADMAYPVPTLERTYSLFRCQHDGGDAERGDESAADGEAEPDHSADSPQLPAQDTTDLVSPALKIGISRQEARDSLILGCPFHQDAPQGGQAAVERG